MTAVQASKIAKETLRPYAIQTAVMTTVLCILYMLLIMVSAITERFFGVTDAYDQELHSKDAILVLLLAAGVMITSVFRNSTDRWIGEATGVLTPCDLGFLDCSSRFWLWWKRVVITLWAYTLLIVSCLPSLLLSMGAFVVLHLSAGMENGTLHFILLMHLLLGAALFTLLPTRLYVAMSALPLCYLKQPHKSPFTVWRYAMQCTAGICFKLLYNRLRYLFSLLLPFHWFSAYPGLIATEMLLCNNNRQKILPDL